MAADCPVDDVERSSSSPGIVPGGRALEEVEIGARRPSSPPGAGRRGGGGGGGRVETLDRPAEDERCYLRAALAEVTGPIGVRRLLGRRASPSSPKKFSRPRNHQQPPEKDVAPPRRRRSPSGGSVPRGGVNSSRLRVSDAFPLESKKPVDLGPDLSRLLESFAARALRSPLTSPCLELPDGRIVEAEIPSRGGAPSAPAGRSPPPARPTPRARAGDLDRSTRRSGRARRSLDPAVPDSGRPAGLLRPLARASRGSKPDEPVDRVRAERDEALGVHRLARLHVRVERLHRGGVEQERPARRSSTPPAAPRW